MTPTKAGALCPLCCKVYLALPHHLKHSHCVLNLRERRIVLSLASGQVNIRSSPCPVPGCSYKSSRLDKHLINGHPELDHDDLVVKQKTVKRARAVQLLAELRASDPEVPMVTCLDLEMPEEEEEEEEEDQVTQEEEILEEESCQNSSCSENVLEIKKLKVRLTRLEREFLLSLKSTQRLATKLRRYKRVLKAMKQGEAGGSQEEEEEEEAASVSSSLSDIFSVAAEVKAGVVEE